YQKTRPVLLGWFLKRNSIPAAQLTYLKKVDSDDWQSVLFQIMFDLENVQWAGLDVATASAATLTARAYYTLKQYEVAISELKRYKDLFDGCDDMLKKEGQIETSPGADAKMWEGRSYYEMAKIAAQKNNSKDAIKYYTRSFKALGRLLMDYPKHRDGAKNYLLFQEVIEELSAVKPSLASALQEQKQKVPRPEVSGGGGEIEKLIPPTANQNFQEKKYAEVVEELYPILVAKRNSTGVPELLNRIILSQVLSQDYFRSLALGDYMAMRYPDSEFTIHSLKTGGNLIWVEAIKKDKEEKEAAAAAEKAAAAAENDGKAAAPAAKKVAGPTSRELKDVAVDFYNRYLKIGIDDQDAAPVALRLAREYYNRAQQIGRQLNAETDQNIRAELKADWLHAFDYVITNYQFIIEHFGNRAEFVDEAYIYQAESYVTTERYAEAASVYERFCQAGSQNKIQLIKAKENISETLYRVAADHEKKTKAIREEAAAVAIPVIPETPVAPKEEDFKKAAAAPAPAAAP
ncbi:MAG: hypothetical protein IKK25_02435, partial [Lentisphaeria bacterium]|nr:hypothetical protein [Lentisphaeria bacterium]